MQHSTIEGSVERIIAPKGKTIEIAQSEQQRKSRLKKNETRHTILFLKI